MKCFLNECCSILHLPSLYIPISIFICAHPLLHCKILYEQNIFMMISFSMRKPTLIRIVGPIYSFGPIHRPPFLPSEFSAISWLNRNRSVLIQQRMCFRLSSFALLGSFTSSFANFLFIPLIGCMFS